MYHQHNRMHPFKVPILRDPSIQPSQNGISFVREPNNLRPVSQNEMYPIDMPHGPRSGDPVSQLYQQPGSTFVRQPKSKAIPIKDPTSGQTLLHADVQTQPRPSTLPAQPPLSTRNKNFGAKSTVWKLPSANILPTVESYENDFPPLGQSVNRSQNKAHSNKTSPSPQVETSQKLHGGTLREDEENIDRSQQSSSRGIPTKSATAGKQESRASSPAFDIYARPFVSEIFTIINQLRGNVFDTLPTKQIDFGVYINRHMGLQSIFLPPIPHPVTLPMSSEFLLTDGTIHTHYESYFRYHLAAEMQSQQRENESYSLYGHEITIQSDNKGQTACSFLVPGLREDSPHVEEDDIIQLRQLRYDDWGRLYGMQEWNTPINLLGGRTPGFQLPLGGRWRHEPAPGWTGNIYNARVSVVQRKQEKLVVRVSGLMDQVIIRAQSGMGTNKFKFNIQFPVPLERYLPMQQVLTIVQETFRQAIGSVNTTPLASPTTLPDYYEPLQQLHRSSQPRYPWIQSMLFPIQVDGDVQTKLNPWSFNRMWFDEQLNWEQRKAVESICTQNYGTLPFLISGPPGTGKTKTLAEIALQLLKNGNKVSHILFCAPSDPAADTIIQRIRTFFNQKELLRLNRPSRTFAEVPDTVLPFCYVSQNKFDLPPFKQIMSYKLVVTTCRDASILLYARLTNCDLYGVEYGLRAAIHPSFTQPEEAHLHWTALLMDESAQAIEPEALIPLCVVAPPLESIKLAFTPLFVMAGDEHQLGPRTSLRSSPLKTSLFSRLFARPVYADHPLARGKAGEPPATLNKAMLPITRPAFANLIRNYRSHPAILAVPSALFYHDTLEPEAKDIDRLTAWSEWRGKKWPVLFCNNESEDDLEMDNGGWYNLGEAHIACRYAYKLMQIGVMKQNEICIMTPFKAQVQSLRKTIRQEEYGSLWDVDIGPTEAFQGLERGVVILCTTRSKQRFVEKDKKVDWGIVGMPNKMNVALTRAKFGLIVIGRREVLREDPNWRAFLNFCDRNGLVAGDSEGGVRLQDGKDGEITRLEKVLLTKEQDMHASRVLRGRGHEDEMWASGMPGLSEDYRESPEDDWYE